MADQLKEIHNADVYLNTFTGTSKSIITTNGTTQYVIKDVQVGTNTIPGTEVLTNNGVTITPTLTANLSGSEIVDVNSTVSVLLPASPVYTKFSVSTLSNAWTSGSIFTDATVYGVAIGSNTSTTPIGTTSPAIASTFNTVGGRNTMDYWFVNGDFYYWTYDGNAQWSFYKRTGGINGSDTLLKDSSNNGSITQNPGTYGYVLYSATANRFYLFGNNNIVVTYNPTNNTSTSVSVSGVPASSSYFKATLSNNGLIFVIPSTSYPATVWAINPATGFYIEFNGLPNWNASCVFATTDQKIFVHFTGTQYHILRTPSISQSYWTRTITNASAIPTFPTSSSSTYNNYTTNTPTGLSLPDAITDTIGGQYLPESYGPNNATFTYVISPSSTAPIVGALDIVNFTLSSTTLTGINISSARGFKYFTPTSTPTGGEISSTTNYPQSIRLRITGVQTTL